MRLEASTLRGIGLESGPRFGTWLARGVRARPPVRCPVHHDARECFSKARIFSEVCNLRLRERFAPTFVRRPRTCCGSCGTTSRHVHRPHFSAASGHAPQLRHYVLQAPIAELGALAARRRHPGHRRSLPSRCDLPGRLNWPGDPRARRIVPVPVDFRKRSSLSGVWQFVKTDETSAVTVGALLRTREAAGVLTIPRRETPHIDHRPRACELGIRPQMRRRARSVPMNSCPHICATHPPGDARDLRVVRRRIQGGAARTCVPMHSVRGPFLFLLLEDLRSRVRVTGPRIRPVIHGGYVMSEGGPSYARESVLRRGIANARPRSGRISPRNRSSRILTP